MTIQLAVPATLTAGAGQPSGVAKSQNRTFVLGPGAVSGDKVGIEGSTDNGTSYQSLVDKDSGLQIVLTPTVLTNSGPEAVIDDLCDHYRMRRLAVGAGSTLARVDLDVEPNTDALPEPIRHQIPVAVTASFTDMTPIGTFFQDRTITGVFYTPNVTVAADAVNNFTITIHLLDSGGALLGTLASFNTAGGVVANLISGFTMSNPGNQGVTLGQSIAWTATEFGAAATLPIGVLEFTLR